MGSLLVAWLAGGCSCEAPEPSAPPLVPEHSSDEPATGPVPANTAACASVGITSDPVVSDAARRANEDALTAHERGDYAASERGFATALADAPSYRGARFNHACALSRLDRLDEARSELLALLCEDLPTYAPRVHTDADLEAVRADLLPVLPAIAEQFRRAAAAGTPLVSFTHGPAMFEQAGTEWEEAQAGVYLAGERRFIPMGPRIHQRQMQAASGSGGFPLLATRYDPQLHRVLLLIARGSDAEGGSVLGPVEARVYDAPLGALLMTHRTSLPDSMDLLGRLDPDGAVLGYDDLDDRSFMGRIELRGTEARRSRTPVDRTGALRAGGVTWTYLQAEPLPAPDAAFTLPDGRSLDLGTVDRHARRIVWTTSDPDVVWIDTSERGYCESRDWYRIERMVVSTGERIEVSSGRDGYAVLEEGTDGALYLQVHDTLYRFDDRGAGPREDVWPGLGITSMANDFNPYC